MVDISGSIMEFHCTKVWIRHQSSADLQNIEVSQRARIDWWRFASRIVPDNEGKIVSELNFRFDSCPPQCPSVWPWLS